MRSNTMIAKAFVLILVCSFVFPAVVFAEESKQSELDIKIEAQTKKVNDMIGRGAGLTAVGLLDFYLAAKFKSEHSDPKKYDQEKAAEGADLFKTLGIIFLAGGITFFIMGMDESSNLEQLRSQKIKVSFKQEGNRTLLLASYNF